MHHTKFVLKLMSCFVFVLSIPLKQAEALKIVNVGGCFDTSAKNNTPSCSFQMSEEANEVQINCVQPGVLQIIGDYKVVYINCSASYPLDLTFDGHKPTEAIETVSWVMVEKNSVGKFKSFHLDVEIFSIPSLHDHYVTLYPQKEIVHSDSYNYSRTGNYIFSGFFEHERFQSKFYIYFEEKSAIHSFLRNEDVVIRLPKLDSKAEENLPLVIPCRPSHFGGNVTIQHDAEDYSFDFDAVIGFTSNESWKSILEHHPDMNLTETTFTCHLNHDDDLMTFSAKKSGIKYGYNGLPTTSFLSVSTKVEPLSNGSFLTEHHCSFDPKSDGIGSLAVYDTPNLVMYRLTQDFIFPIFHNRSYSTTVVNTTLLFGISSKQITTLSMATNVLCQDATTFHASTVGIVATGRHIQFLHGFDFSRAREIGSRETFNYFKIVHDQPKNALYENQMVTFRCFVHSFPFVRPAIWYTERANGSIRQEVVDYNWKDNHFSHAQIRLTADVRKVICAASIATKPKWRNFSMDIKLERSIKPKFDESQIPLQKFLLNSNQILKCTATGIPEPHIYWRRNGKNITSGVSLTNHTSILEVSDVKQSDAGEYVCIASNVASVKKKIFTVQVFVEMDAGLIIGLSILVVICGVLAISSWVYFKLRTGKAALSKSEIDDFLNGESNKNENNSKEAICDRNKYAHDVTHLRPYNTEFEIKQNRFRIDTSQKLGSGAFGMVVMGYLDGVPVAVKTVKRNAEKSYFKALLSELKVMTFLGDHENIVGILGASTGNLKKGQVFIFVPYCALGCLQEYLRSNRRCFYKHSTDLINATTANKPNVSFGVGLSQQNVYENTTPITNKDSISPTDRNLSDIITTTNLYQWAIQIAQGMEYLSSKKVLHGDLAARNILLAENRIAKITDFGLSRRLYDYSEYAKTQQEPLPWRWMSIESLRDLTFSTQSDVWSYGITLWEMFSLGQVPYPGYSWTMDFVDELESGMRLSCPQFASEELYNAVMQECWQNDHQLRPSFTQIQETLKSHYQL